MPPIPSMPSLPSPPPMSDLADRGRDELASPSDRLADTGSDAVADLAQRGADAAQAALGAAKPDPDEMYEQVLERLRRDLIHELELHGHLLRHHP